MELEKSLRITSSSFSVKSLVDMYHEGKIKIPQYQRRYQYTAEQKNNLITSLLLNLPIDSLTCVKDNSTWILCDGMHRIVTLSTFIKDGFPYKSNIGTASKFTVNKDLNNKTFSNLPLTIKTELLNRSISVSVIESKEPFSDQLVLNVMQAKNSCALPMTKSRMALNEVMSHKEGVTDAWSKLNKEFKSSSIDEPLLGKAMNRSAVTNMFKYLSDISEDSTFMVKVVDRFVKTWSAGEAFNELQMAGWIQAMLMKSYIESNQKKL